MFFILDANKKNFIFLILGLLNDFKVDKTKRMNCVLNLDSTDVLRKRRLQIRKIKKI